MTIEKENEDIAFIHRMIMESIAKKTSKYDDKKGFSMATFSIAISLMSTLLSFGVDNIDEYLDEFISNVKKIKDATREHYSYMIYKDGEKITEGQFN